MGSSLKRGLKRNRKGLIAVFVALGVLSTAVTGTAFLVSKQGRVAEERYLEQVSFLKKDTIGSVYNRMKQGESFYLFIGVRDCPDCQRFAPVLQGAYGSLSGELREYIRVMAYIEFSKLSEYKGTEDVQLAELMGDSKSVPYLAYVSNGKVEGYLEIGRYTSQGQVVEFIKSFQK